LDDESFRLLADNIPILCWVANGDGYIVWYNRRWHDYCGTTPEQMKGWGWTAVHDPDALPVVMEEWQKAVASGAPFEMTFPMRGADGVLRPFLTRIQPVRDASGQVARWFGVNTEISDQVEAEEAARMSEARARADKERVQLALAAGAIIGTWFWDLPADKFTVDEGFAISFGLDPSRGRDHLTLEQVLETVHPEDKPSLVEAINEAVARGGAYAHQYRVRRADGQYYWLEANGRVEKAADGTPLRFSGVLLDVEERVALLAEREAAMVALQAAEERLRLATDAAEVGFWDLDLITDKLIWPPVLKSMFGLPVNATVTIDDFYAGLHPLDRDATIAAFQAALDPNRRAIYDVEYRTIGRDDGIVRWVAAKGRGFFDQTGRCVRVLGTAIDITKRKAVEAELHELNTRLEQRVAEEIAERAKAEEALRQSQKMEAVGQLTGGIAHDFNNLLTVVIGNIDMGLRALDAAGGDPRVRRALLNAQKGAERAASLTQRLLAFSRRQPLAPKPLDLDRLIANMSDLLTRALGETIHLEITTTPGLWRVEVDPNQMESAILNLALNARDAMPRGGTLTIESANAQLDEAYVASHPEVAPGPYVVIAVTDTGLGMSKETLGRAFEPFFTTKDVGKGTGLGLSMVYGFTKQSGGHVKLYSEENCGTTVKIYLPRLVRQVGEPSESLPADDLETGRREETILAVEDNDDVRAYTVECLRELGYRVLEAHDAASALRLLERQDNPIDLLFTDVVMPGASGRELAEAARARQPNLRVLYTSGYTRNAIVHGGRLDAGVEMISKPFTVQALARKVRDVLDSGRTKRMLIVEAEPTVRALAVEILSTKGYVVEVAASATEALTKVRVNLGRYDVVVIDDDLPDKSGQILLADLRAIHADLPLVLAVERDELVAQRRLSDRATRLIAKPYNGARLMHVLDELGVTTRSMEIATKG
jgi:PAS domain S-box-containing protein